MKAIYSVILLLMTSFVFCMGVIPDSLLKDMLLSSSLNTANHAIQYSLDWSLSVLNENDEVKSQQTSKSIVEFFYNEQNYLLKSVCNHYNSINDKTVVFYYWTPEITYQLVAGKLKDGTRYPSILSIEESGYNPLTMRENIGGKLPVILHHKSHGVYEPFIFGLFPMQLFDGKQITVSDDELNELNRSACISIDLSQPYFKRFIEGHANTVESTFDAKVQKVKIGYVISEYQINHMILSESSKNHYLNYIIIFRVDRFDENGFPVEGSCSKISNYYRENMIERKQIEDFHWVEMTYSKVMDVSSYTQRIIDDLEKKKVIFVDKD